MYKIIVYIYIYIEFEKVNWLFRINFVEFCVTKTTDGLEDLGEFDREVNYIDIYRLHEECLC